MELRLREGEELTLKTPCKLKTSATKKKKKPKTGTLWITSQRLAFIYDSAALPRQDVRA
jgi:hypothetical protein